MRVKIVLTGAPSSGKSSVMKELARRFGGRVLLVPESSVVLLSGGFPAPDHDDVEQIRHFQHAILNVQAGLEHNLPRQRPGAEFMVFDRASLDGAGFWPPGPGDFLETFGVDVRAEYAKFSHVLFMELPRPEVFGGTSDFRFHDYDQSLASEEHLETVWGDHPRFTRVPPARTLAERIEHVLGLVTKILNEDARRPAPLRLMVNQSPNEQERTHAPQRGPRPVREDQPSDDL